MSTTRTADHLTAGVTPAPDQRHVEGLVTNVVTGPLAERIRARLFGLPSNPVTITEERCEWGTEWTREFESAFTVACGGMSQEFRPDNQESDLGWVEGASLAESIRDTVYVRFDAWLRALDDTDALVAEWFEPYEACDWWESWTVRAGTPLFRAVSRRARGRVERVTLARVTEASTRDRHDRTKLADTGRHAWRLDGIAAARDDGFREIVHREHFERGARTVPGVIGRDVLLAITDRHMQGDPR